MLSGFINISKSLYILLLVTVIHTAYYFPHPEEYFQVEVHSLEEQMGRRNVLFGKGTGSFW